jgi:hypothetical protein
LYIVTAQYHQESAGSVKNGILNRNQANFIQYLFKMLLHIFLLLVSVCYLCNLRIYVTADGYLEIASPNLKWEYRSSSKDKYTVLTRKWCVYFVVRY